MKVLLAACDSLFPMALYSLKAYLTADPRLQARLDEITIVSPVIPDPERFVAEVLRVAEKLRPDVIGMSVYVWSRYHMYRLAPAIRTILPAAKIVWGGPDVSDPQYARKLLERHRAVDAIVIDEGERTFSSLLRSYLGDGPPLREIPGIVYRDCDQTIRGNGPVELLRHLDVLPSIFELDEVKELLDATSAIGFETFRGCYARCSYCHWGEQTRRAYSVERVCADLDSILSHRNIKTIWCFDSMFGFNRKWAKEIMRFFIARRRPDQRIWLFPNLDFLDQELCELFREGDVSVELGVQTVDPQVYRNLDRRWTLEEFLGKVELLEKNGVVPRTQELIVGLPGETFQGVCDSIDFSFAKKPDVFHIFPFLLLPGTRLWERQEEFGLEYRGVWRDVFASKSISETDNLRCRVMAYVAYSWYFVFPGLAQAVVSLLGLRPSRLLLQIGELWVREAFGIELAAPHLSSEVCAGLRARLFLRGISDGNLATVGFTRRALKAIGSEQGLAPQVGELVEHHALLDRDPEIVDARNLEREVLDELMDRWRCHPARTGPFRAGFDIFRPETGREKVAAAPLRFVAYPIPGRKVSFDDQAAAHKKMQRHRVILIPLEGEAAEPLQVGIANPLPAISRAEILAAVGRR